MQSIPPYYAPTYPPPSPYPTTTASTNATTATTATSSPGSNGSTVMTISNTPPALLSNGLTPIETGILTTSNSGSQTPGTKRNQVKNACSK
jgi:hypothetical protein